MTPAHRAALLSEPPMHFGGDAHISPRPGLTITFPGYVGCCRGGRAAKVTSEGRVTFDAGAVTCERCLVLLAESVEWGRKFEAAAVRMPGGAR